jgi:hypothetical protein
MKSLSRRFENLKNKNEGWSSYSCFANALIGQNFSHPTINRLFKKMVDKDDYALNEKNEILGYLKTL